MKMLLFPTLLWKMLSLLAGIIQSAAARPRLDTDHKTWSQQQPREERRSLLGSVHSIAAEYKSGISVSCMNGKNLGLYCCWPLKKIEQEKRGSFVQRNIQQKYTVLHIFEPFQTRESGAQCRLREKKRALKISDLTWPDWPKVVSWELVPRMGKNCRK